MTPAEIVRFINHKYGEQAYIVDDGKEIRIFTAKSVWRIFKTDYSKFHGYYLYHSNNKSGSGFHNQGNHKSGDINWLVWYAILHDSDVNIAYTKENYEKFQRGYNLYTYGQKLYESCCQFAFLSGSDLIEGSV